LKKIKTLRVKNWNHRKPGND